MSQIGEPGDKRRFSRKPVGDGITANVVVDKTPLPHCTYCKLEITGKFFVIAKGKYECLRCHNEG